MAHTLPAEWHEQSAILMTWPHKETDWLPWLEAIEQTYIEIISNILTFEPVVVACHDETIQQRVLGLFSDNKFPHKLHTFIAPCNDTWARDHGPITLIEDDSTLVLDYTFNAWGAKYHANLDDMITQQLIQQPFVNLADYQRQDLVLEGGSIESDGNGTVLTTEICLLNENRNPSMSKAQIEHALKSQLNMQQVIWLSAGHLPGDDTDAHIDTLARFSPDGIVYVTDDKPNSNAYAALKIMEQELKNARNVEGKPYRLYALPSPTPVLNDEGEPLPATYANFLIINGAVLVPTYNDANDEKALQVIQQAFPSHTIIGINCRTVIEQFGSLHCLTMQLPKGLIHVDQ